MQIPRQLILIALLAVALVGCRTPARGEELAVHWGSFGVGDTEQLFQVGAEYRFRPVWRGIAPNVGVSVLEDGGSYVYGGARYDWEFVEDFELSPSFAAGIYSAESWDLGGPLEFRSGLDLGYRITESWKLAAGIYHLSNGGMYSLNGGSEVALFSLIYSF